MLNNQIPASSKSELIRSLKSELGWLENIQQQYAKLAQQTDTIQHSYDQLQQSRNRKEEEHRAKIEKDASIIQQLKEELQNISREAEDIIKQIMEAQTRNDSMRKINQTQKKDTEVLKKQILILQSDQEVEHKKLASNISDSLEQQREVNKRLEVEKNEKTARLQEIMMKCKCLEREIGAKQNSNQKLDARLMKVSSEAQEVKQSCRNINDDLRRTNAKHSLLEEIFDRLLEQLKKIEEEIDQRKLDVEAAQLGYTQELQRNKSLNYNLQRYERELKQHEKEIDELAKKRNAQLAQYNREVRKNKYLNSKLDANLDIIQEYESINTELVREVRLYLQIDQKAIRILDRADRTLDLLKRVQRKLKQSKISIAHILKY